jgi:hypothetical protein
MTPDSGHSLVTTLAFALMAAINGSAGSRAIPTFGL